MHIFTGALISISMTLKEKVAVLKKHGELYLLDDFLGVVLKMSSTHNGEVVKCLKWKGRQEKVVEDGNETACDIYIDSSSRQVTKEFYEKY